MPKNMGIYKITCLSNKRFYIGSSNDLKKRKRDHFRELSYNRHHSNRMQRSYNKYGKENFIFEVIEYIFDEVILRNREQYWMDKTKSYDKNIGFNISYNAYGGHFKGKDNGMYGKTHTDDVKRKLRELFSGGNNERSKAVLQYSLQGDFIKEYGSAREASRETNLSHSGIIGSCINQYKQSSDFIWLYKDDFNEEYLKLRIELAKEPTNYAKQDTAKRVVQLNLSLKYVRTFNSIYETSKITGFDISSICSCCKGKVKTCKGYVFVYESDYLIGNYRRDVKHKTTAKKVVRINPLNNELIDMFESVKEAEEKFNISSGSISRVCNNKMKTTGGYKWMYYNDYINTKKGSAS
ncbi:hypothetical protein BTGOE4_10360 [Bacillus thuringiensis]|uniref:GIY-YIG domain-containing protein n=1 Tax=Bacillus thuringiensis TaxID=1428 RepID=A0A9X5N722_BACTU|nr:NUMOD1 domain-containing DNA-binding protein [Bacillus thuringiensis]OFC94646.1 hypothetical protein BTGOE4_10360 [Bacillus thuringiensis]